ncbi:hypothetical protein Q5H93_06210 [Hymenobacter sp. ASUV-10]|uniref:Uncharacterized protein n=1 Tax=Hymenobacter aranciens TaxID=3063996 RepID=A0ABT9B7R7_9BACT|nr:hypothetical protein [Hymenobacter sp. ASUV-10]MDO7874319.1 hypothetical protein [Hymenobacter sp. ASUV-10]
MFFANPPFSKLPEDVQSDVVAIVRKKMAEDKKLIETIRLYLAEVESRIEGYELFLKDIPENCSLGVGYECTSHNEIYRFKIPAKLKPLRLFNSCEYREYFYDSEWPQAKKILFVLRNPQHYGHGKTISGIKGVTRAIMQEEPELQREGEEAVMKRIGPTLSRMAKDNKEVIKMNEKGSKGTIHYLSPDWFEDGRIKPEYKDAVSNLEILNH